MSTNVRFSDNQKLQGELDTERELYAALKDEVVKLREQQSDESRDLEQQLLAGTRSEEQLKAQLDSRSDLAEKLGQRLLAQQLRYHEQLNVAEAELVSAKTDLAAVKGELSRVQDGRIDAQLTLVRLESNLSKQQLLISSQESEISKLQSEVTKVRAQTEKPQIEQLPLIVAAGPAIEIIEPLMTVTRGGPTLKFMGNTANSFEVIGKVSPSNNLLSFKVDSKAVDLNDNGVFKYTADSAASALRMVAINDAGERTDIEMRLSKSKNRGSADQDQSTDLSGIKFGNYHALIIGNNDFEYMQNLKTAENDAIVIEALLREKYGFKTKLLLNATRYETLSALNELRATLTSDDNLLIYYAGHGELANETGYWLPVDAEPDSDVNWIPNSTITKYVETINAKPLLSR